MNDSNNIFFKLILSLNTCFFVDLSARSNQLLQDTCRYQFLLHLSNLSMLFPFLIPQPQKMQTNQFKNHLCCALKYLILIAFLYFNSNAKQLPYSLINQSSLQHYSQAYPFSSQFQTSPLKQVYFLPSLNFCDNSS